MRRTLAATDVAALDMVASPKHINLSVDVTPQVYVKPAERDTVTTFAKVVVSVYASRPQQTTLPMLVPTTAHT
jgi:hypothetical protein